MNSLLRNLHNNLLFQQVHHLWNEWGTTYNAAMGQQNISTCSVWQRTSTTCFTVHRFLAGWWQVALFVFWFVTSGASKFSDSWSTRKWVGVFLLWEMEASSFDAPYILLSCITSPCTFLWSFKATILLLLLHYYNCDLFFVITLSRVLTDTQASINSFQIVL